LGDQSIVILNSKLMNRIYWYKHGAYTLRILKYKLHVL